VGRRRRRAQGEGLQVKLSEMLTLYRAAAPPEMREVAAEFAALSPSEQRELLFWMAIDIANNPTTIRSQDAGPGQAGHA
jgi:hypothetical protein